jgi:hypothetical protein
MAGEETIMKLCYPQVFKTKRGKFTVALVGQPDEHMMNWNGCNYRRMALPKELRKKFDTAEEAFAYEKLVDTERLEELTRYAYENGQGSSFNEADMVMKGGPLK